MGDFCSLLFELSNDDRMKILENLHNEKLNLSHLAKMQNITITEASRHIQRLVEAQIIEKGPEGRYQLTPYGELILQQLPGLQFIQANRKYFLEHDTTHLPHQFINRIGELSISSKNKDSLESIAYAEQILEQAEMYSWSLTPQIIVSSLKTIEGKIREGVKIRSLLPENVSRPPGFYPVHGVERRTLPNIQFRVMVTEKEAMFGLPFLNGQMDYAQLFSRDSKFHEWCKDLFLFYWEKAKPVLSFPNTSK